MERHDFLMKSKCLIYGTPCTKESCHGCPHEQQAIRDFAIVQGAFAELPSLSDDERRHRENLAAQRAVADAQAAVANQLYWMRRSWRSR